MNEEGLFLTETIFLCNLLILKIVPLVCLEISCFEYLVNEVTY